ncbi:MAG: U32 family peptidase, partial [Muribaculum sp.]|nr:U32 family peptidase [Muribaculum sp.]
MSRNNHSAIRPLELLAPARNAEVARQAVLHGADAVYIGAAGFGARAAASNSFDDIKAVVEVAHSYGARVYVTVNTIVYDSELKGVEQMIRELYRVGVDALIVQDLGILRMDIPPIDLHASTQCDIRTHEKARFLESLGFSQLVLPRELSLEEIAAIRSATSVPLEAFVHGALCVSYSGDCQASQLTCGRSANRGECAQICRYAFDLYAGTSDYPVVRGKHLLSLRDLNRSDSLEAMAAAGISSFKIEGRLKDPAYVKNIVALYRRRLDAIIDSHPELYCRASEGITDLKFTPQADRSFNRGFTSYFLNGTPVDNPSMASPDTPKSRGQLVGTVRSVRDSGRIVEASLLHPLANGDGLGYFSPDEGFVGFRINKA